MAARKIGALLVVERQEGLRNYAESGIRLDARLSFDLLVNLFTPGTPLHDGAAIVQGDRIASAACFLPLSSSHELTKDFGTRHRAAVGISEETDALAVVVSEESGRISLAVGGQLLRDLDAAALRRELGERLAVDPHRHAKGVASASAHGSGDCVCWRWPWRWRPGTSPRSRSASGRASGWSTRRSPICPRVA